jgi:hypothetical protein
MCQAVEHNDLRYGLIKLPASLFSARALQAWSMQPYATAISNRLKAAKGDAKDEKKKEEGKGSGRVVFREYEYEQITYTNTWFSARTLALKSGGDLLSVVCGRILPDDDVRLRRVASDVRFV